LSWIKENKIKNIKEIFRPFVISLDIKEDAAFQHYLTAILLIHMVIWQA